MNWRRPALHL